MLATRPRGTTDVLPPRSERWIRREQRFREVCRAFGYPEIILPMFEHAELFQRTVGEATDIVEKELYVFPDRGGRLLALRPEGTASAARAYLENGLHRGPQPVRLSYVGPMFRYERPQAGRFRQHTQMGVEVFGADQPTADVEVILLAAEYLRKEGLTELSVRLNSIGCPDCRPAYREALRRWAHPLLPELCEDCRSRYHRNPLRLLDCKETRCATALQEAPRSLETLCSACEEHFAAVRGYLADLDLPVSVDPNLVRGIDYYTRTVFEVVHGRLGAQRALCGGGRYDGLVEVLGGPPTPGVGFGMGLERVLDVLESAGETEGDARPDLFLAIADERARSQAFAIATDARRRGLATLFDLGGRSLKAQMKAAARAGARFALVLGERELATGTATLREMDTGQERGLPLAEVVDALCRG